MTVVGEWHARVSKFRRAWPIVGRNMSIHTEGVEALFNVGTNVKTDGHSSPYQGSRHNTLHLQPQHTDVCVTQFREKHAPKYSTVLIHKRS